MNNLVKRLRAWSDDARAGRDISGADYDLRRASDKIEGMDDLIIAALEMIKEYEFSVGNGITRGEEMIHAAIKRMNEA